MELADLVSQRSLAQSKFNKDRSLTQNELVIEALSHLMEEVVEARQCVPRRYWKDEKFNREEFLKEICDIFIWASNTAGLAGFTGGEVEQALQNKLNYNETRKDHLHNQ